MSMNYDFTKDPKKMKALLAAHNIQELNDVLQDPIWLSMTSTLGMYRSAPNFPEVLRCFWTTLCMLNGIGVGTTVYDCLLDRLRNVYTSIGIVIDGSFMGDVLEAAEEDDD